ncbi:type IV pilin protein [Thalassotalea atypica]|uniref:type IV pilin protein n=1 Tax=Thalassotalea atypica TaxID=2054316 RepID=UPI002573B633|nr:type IV pilin protein [Thalassotalea atypica]
MNIKNNIRGFTLIEVMIVVAIVGILAAVGYPSYTSYVAKSNRTEGQRELLRVAGLMEQHFLDNRSYTADMTELGLSADPYITTQGGGGGYYSIDAAITAGTFTLTATAVGTQASADAACKTLTITNTGYRDASGTDCWEN